MYRVLPVGSDIAQRVRAAPPELLLDLPQRYSRIFNRCNAADLTSAQVAGLIEALHDQLHAGARIADPERRAIWHRALRLVGRCAA